MIIKIFKLNHQRKESFQELQSRNDLVITSADKGGAIVILDGEDYVKEAERQLNNRETYEKINYDPTTANNKTIKKVMLIFQKSNVLRKNISEELKTENPKTLHFNLKPKIHKKGNLGRPVIS